MEFKKVATELGSVVTTYHDGYKTLNGHTRAGVKLSRPVEAGTMWDSAKTKCPFHRADEQSLAEYGGEGGVIRVLGNRFTPHHKHRLIIPKACTDEEFVRTLGGPAFLTRSLEIIGELAGREPEEWVFAAHVLRGQNVPHLHWHLYAYHPEEEVDLKREAAWTVHEENSNLVLWTTEEFEVVARGTKVGQLMIVPMPLLNEVGPWPSPFKEVAHSLHAIIQLTNEAFRSPQGERPRYSVTGRIGKDGRIRYVTYVPDLQMYGCSDDAADFNGTARSRAWSPEETADHLKKFK